MNIEHLREFSYLAETLSFSITAKHFFISTSVLSKHIAAMEAELGVQLFERDRHGVDLTAAGSVFYEGISKVLAEYDFALQSISPEHMGKHKVLRVGYLRNAASPFLGRFVASFSSGFPDIDLDITCMEYRELLYAHRSHKVDVLLDMDVDPEVELACDSAYIYSDRICAVVAHDHPLAARTQGIDASELAHNSFILPDHSAYPGYAQRCEQIIDGLDGIEVCYRYKDIDTFVFKVQDSSCVGFSSGHNASVFGDKLTFIPIHDKLTHYDITARWLRVTDPDLIEATKAAAADCAAFMKSWSDGLPR